MTQTKFPQSAQQILQNFIAALSGNDLESVEGKRRANALTVRQRNGEGGEIHIKVLCPYAARNDALYFRVGRREAQGIRSDYPWWFPDHGNLTKLSIAASFVAIPVPGESADYWIIDGDQAEKLFTPLPSAGDEVESGYALDLSAMAEGVPVRNQLEPSRNNFAALLDAIRSIKADEPLLSKFTLPELEKELHDQLIKIGLAVSMHFNVGQAAHLSGNAQYVRDWHSDSHGSSSFWLHALDEFDIADMEDHAITFQVRRLYALVFENRWDDLLSEIDNPWRNIKLAIDRLDDFLQLAEPAYHIACLFDPPPPARLRALALMAKARLKVINGVPVPFAEFAALAQIGERSMINLVSQNGALNAARVRYDGKACIDTTKALKWIDRRPLFHRASDDKASADMPFSPLAVQADGMARLLVEIFRKITATVADGKTIDDFFQEHGYADTPDAVALLRRAMKGDFDWVSAEDDAISNARENLFECLLVDIATHPDFPNRKMWLWAIRYSQFFG